MTYVKHGEFTKGPWTIKQYGPSEEGGRADGSRWSRYNGSRYTINEIGVDVHPLYDGSGRKKEYPDGVIMRPEDVREVVALIQYAPDLRDALHGLLLALEFRNDAQQMAEAMQHAHLVLALATTPVGITEGVPK